MPEMGISTAQFGLVVSAYAISAGISGLLAAGFADKFDRKKMLLFFYVGFVLGTLFCGVVNSYRLLLLATGGFMIMPFSSAFLVNNVLIPETRLSLIFFIVGYVTIGTMILTVIMMYFIDQRVSAKLPGGHA